MVELYLALVPVGVALAISYAVSATLRHRYRTRDLSLPELHDRALLEWDGDAKAWPLDRPVGEVERRRAVTRQAERGHQQGHAPAPTGANLVDADAPAH